MCWSSMYVTFTDPKAAHYLEIAKGVLCNINTWLKNYDPDPSVCFDLIRSRSDCSQVYFNHATDGDGNCGCISDADCTKVENHESANAVRIYMIQVRHITIQGKDHA